jgi:hypothetical protein
MSGEVIVALIAAGAAVAGAIVSAYNARRNEKDRVDAARLLELEKRVATSRAEVFEPLVEAIGRVWDLVAAGKADDKAFRDVAFQDLQRFNHWVQIYGSDESVRFAHRFMQALYAEAPPFIVLRFMAELILQARRELGYPETELNALDLLGIRINDVYADPAFYDTLTLPPDELYAREGWTPPWDRATPSPLEPHPSP